MVGVGLAWLELVGSFGVRLSCLHLRSHTELTLPDRLQYLAGGPVAGFILDAQGGSDKGIEAFRPVSVFPLACCKPI